MYYFHGMDLKLRNLPKAVWGWALYDFANSAFATTVMSVVFSVYFAKALVPPEGALVLGMRVPAESLWGYMVSGVMALVIVLSPGLGALADQHDAKGPFLAWLTAAGAAATAALYFATPGRLWFGFWLGFVGLFCYELALVFYNAFLNDVSDSQNAGRVSGFGFALGYIGGGLCLALNMAMMARPVWFGLSGSDATLPVRASISVAGVWWLLFSFPTFLWVRDTHPSANSARGTVLSALMGALQQLWRSWKSLAAFPQLKRFLISYLIFNDGIQTIILMASIFGAKELGMSATQLALVYLMVQFVAFVGAMIFGRLADAWSHKNVLLTTLAVYTVLIAWAVFMTSATEFWAMAVVVGIVLGGSQAAARSLYAVMIPSERAGEFFALYAVVGKAAALIGPAVFGVASQVGGLRVGIASLLIFFVLGGFLLFSVDETSGRTLR